MAHFYADIQGNRGPASRMGSKESGLRAHIRGWTVGARVICHNENGRDVVDVYMTSGSSGTSPSEFVVRFSVAENGAPIRIEIAPHLLKGIPI